jgi:glutaconate CoA-transferase, subunit A
LLAALQAGASGVPFTPVPGLLGSDLLRVRPDYRVILNPFDREEQVVLVPAIRPDIALLHAVRAEPTGAAIFSAHGDAVMLAQASRTVIVTAEEIYDGAAAVLAPDERLLAGIYVDMLVAAPNGCWPLGLRGHYGPDETALAAYLLAARASESFATYLRAFVEPAATMAGSR